VETAKSKETRKDNANLVVEFAQNVAAFYSKNQQRVE